MWRRLLLVVVLAAAGCAEVEKQPEPVAVEAPVIEKQAAESKEPKFKNSTLKYLANRNLKPQPTRPLNVRSRCNHRDAIGTQTRLDLLVKEASVKTFVAEVSMKGHGSCRFDLNKLKKCRKPCSATRNSRIVWFACGSRGQK